MIQEVLLPPKENTSTDRNAQPRQISAQFLLTIHVLCLFVPNYPLLGRWASSGYFVGATQKGSCKMTLLRRVLRRVLKVFSRRLLDMFLGVLQGIPKRERVLRRGSRKKACRRCLDSRKSDTRLSESTVPFACALPFYL